MSVYYILLGIPVFLKIMLLSFGKDNVLKKDDYLKAERKIIAVFFIIFFFILALRRKDIGVDLSNYELYFKRNVGLSYSDLTRFKTEYGYSALNKFVMDIHNDFQFYLVVVAFITVLPLGLLYYKESENALLSIGIFINLSVFNMYFSGLRQAIAIAISVLAFYCVKNKKLIWFLLCVFLAYNFHHSAIVLLLLYPIFHIKFTKKSLIAIIPVISVIFIFKERVFNFLLTYFADDYSSKYGDQESNGAYMVLLLFIIFLLYSFFMIDDSAADNEVLGLRNVMVLATCIQFFASLNTVAMRINYYFIPLIPLLVSKVYYRANEENKKVVTVANIIMIVFFFGYFFYTAYTGSDTLQIFPYRAFWQEGAIN